ncbi:MAG: hypothetical protein GXP25_14725 [Planctomycetes bacterium]|nr:hypothetical protein [Planctomycetota bacterium]
MSARLCGSPSAIGEAWGAVNAVKIREHLGAFLDEWRGKGLTEEDLLRRAKRGGQIIERMAPHWREEADAIARRADVDSDLYNAYLIGKYRSVLSRECTSFAAVGEATADGRPLFHKNRDNVDRWQAGYVKKTKVPREDINGFIATGDVSDTGVMMMVNDHGLAGSADRGVEAPEWYGEGLTNPYGLRYIAEKAETCEQALDTVMWMTKDRLYAGGARQTNWLFVDASGTALRVISSNEAIVDYEFIRSGVLLNCERQGLRGVLDGNVGRIDGRLMRRASRMGSVALDSTICALTAEIDPERPAELTCAWIALGNPSECPYVPALMAADETPQEMMDGMLYHLSRSWQILPVYIQKCELMGAEEVERLRSVERHLTPRANECLLENATRARRLFQGMPADKNAP